MSKVFKGIKKIHKKVFKAVKKHLKKGHERIKKYGKYVAAAVAIYFTAGAAMAAFAPTAGIAASMPGVTSFAGAIGINTAGAAAAGTAAAGTAGVTAAQAGAALSAAGGGGMAGMASGALGAATQAAATTAAGSAAVMAGGGAVGAATMGTSLGQTLGGGVAKQAGGEVVRQVGAQVGKEAAKQGIWAGLTSMQKAQVAFAGINMGLQALQGAVAPSAADEIRDAMAARWSNAGTPLDPDAFKPTGSGDVDSMWDNPEWSDGGGETMVAESDPGQGPNNVMEIASNASSNPVNTSRIGGKRENEVQPFQSMDEANLMASETQDRLDARTQSVDPVEYQSITGSEDGSDRSEMDAEPMSLALADEETEERQKRAFAKYDPFMRDERTV